VGDRKGLILAVAGLAVAIVVVLAATGPRLEQEASGPIRRYGGACLQLERWGLLGWRALGQSYTVADIRDGTWHELQEPPPCAPVPDQTYMVRPPSDAPTGSYRICGLSDDEPCLEFRRIEFIPGPPGP
jgi:hypothetical protein